LNGKTPESTQFEPKLFKKGKPPDPLSFEVIMTAEAAEKQRKTGVVQLALAHPHVLLRAE